MMSFMSPKALREIGVLGMNMRNADFIMKYNPRNMYPLVDDKLITKKLALEKGIAVPKLYGVISYQHEVDKLEELILSHHTDLVIKPAEGSGGNGIMVLTGKIGKMYSKASGDLVSLETLQHHVSNTLSGMYSLGGLPDRALFEYRVQFDPFFDKISYQGVPDIRVIVFRGVPVAAMIRLPTRASDGKANLHQGALGLGIDLATGATLDGVCQNQKADHHPDTGYKTKGIEIPNWQQILRLAVECADIVGLGYLGVDIVMDKNLGPLMLELNARPGLNVQIANQRGLVPSLRKIEKIPVLPVSIEERLALAVSVAGH
ncbi:alpha-L-glutamate ligase-like protein [Allohahella sp. A8]|uniref:alpha-L-glutamate ligase-like protein n=1 Tax=Allohahella sp. A8 TaxID=3141461 RepID=UPI000C093F8A|nr:alpha-L-glutamate ligase-like protein [Hahellaceae bacterium]|tara:strand:- start:46770 stop:47720 length:951 start_codon:yes stop_codon:yes gene_type:complete